MPPASGQNAPVAKVERPGPPPLPSLSNRYRKDARLAELFDRDIAPVFSEPFGRLLLSRLPPLGKAMVLDCMCRGGFPGLELLRLYPEARLVAIDPSSGLIGRARDHAGALVGRRAFFRTESAEPELPFDDEAFDLVLSNLGLYDVAQPRQLLRELVRVAKPSASVVCTIPLRGSYAEFYALLESLLSGQPAQLDRLKVHTEALPDAGRLREWASQAGLTDIEVSCEPFSMLFAGGPDLFFAPAIEYGPLGGWKSVVGDKGPGMQAAFSELRAAIDLLCSGSGDAARRVLGRGASPSPISRPLPFVLTVRAGCLRARRPG